MDGVWPGLTSWSLACCGRVWWVVGEDAVRIDLRVKDCWTKGGPAGMMLCVMNKQADVCVRVACRSEGPGPGAGDLRGGICEEAAAGEPAVLEGVEVSVDIIA